MFFRRSINFLRSSFVSKNTSRTIRCIAFVAIMALALNLNAGDAQGDKRSDQQLPYEVRAVLSNLVKIVSEPYRYSNDSERDEAHRSFHSRLGELGQLIGDSLYEGISESAGPSIEKSLIAMGVDRARNPAYYEELMNRYGAWGTYHHDDGSVKHDRGGHCPPLLLLEHTTGGYRSTWESLWLGPPSRNTRFMTRGLLATIDEFWSPSDVRLQALAKIGDSESIPIIASRTKLEHQSYRTDVLRAFGYFCSEEALSAILDYVSTWEATSPDESVVVGKRTLRQYAIWMLTDPERRGMRMDGTVRANKWREVIERFPKDGLPPDQRELLEQVLAFKR